MIKKTNVLFVCIHNSARSQMAEAWLQKLGGEQYEVHSAGLEQGKLNPLVVEVMQEVGIDITQKKANTVAQYLAGDLQFDYVITVCDAANGERCPLFPGKVQRLHWGFEDPSSLSGTADDKLKTTRLIRDQIKEKVQSFI